MQMLRKRLHRSELDAMIGGVAGGLASSFGISSTILRLLWAASLLVGGAGLAIYLLAWVIIPDEDGRRTFMPLLVLALAIVLPLALALLWILPVTVTTTS
jgi:phage shock protein C